MRHNFLRFLRFFVLSVVFAGLPLLGAPSHGGETGNASAQSEVERRVRLTWTYHPRPELVRDGYLRTPLPTHFAPYQSVRWEVAGAREHRMAVEKGNQFLVVAPDGEKPFTVTADVTVRPFPTATLARSLAVADDAATPVVPPELAAYLGATEGIDPRDPAIRALAARLRGGTPVATMTNIILYLQRTVRYDLRRTSADAGQVLQRRAAHCGGYAALFVALARANDIPARQVWGLSWSFDRRTRHPRARGSQWFADHEWAEAYLPGTGWTPVEPQGDAFRAPSLGCVRLTHYEPARGNYLKDNAVRMGAHPPAVEELEPSAPEQGV